MPYLPTVSVPATLSSTGLMHQRKSRSIKLARFWFAGSEKPFGELLQSFVPILASLEQDLLDQRA